MAAATGALGLALLQVFADPADRAPTVVGFQPRYRGLHVGNPLSVPQPRHLVERVRLSRLLAMIEIRRGTERKPSTPPAC